MNKITIVAHRGCRKPFTENTVEAFKYAIENGNKAVEMDVRYDYWHHRFFLEHDRLHLPSKKRNLLEKIIPTIPKDVTIFIELKTVSWLSKRFARHFLKTFQELFPERETVVISFNPFVLTFLKKLSPKMRLGFLCGNPLWNFCFQKFFWKLMQPEYFLLHKRLLNPKNVKFGKEHRMKIFSFVLNKEKEWEKAIELGVDGITTDETIALKKYLSGEK